MEYSIVIYFDPVDKIYVASVPELQGCMAHGNTRKDRSQSDLLCRDFQGNPCVAAYAVHKDALREIQVACELWLETAEEDGITIPKPVSYIDA